MVKERIKIIKKGADEENSLYYLELGKAGRLEHLEQLRTQYINWQNDSEQGFQRVYRVIRKT